MLSPGNWDDIIDMAEAERFVGREQELEVFRKEISQPFPSYLIFYITGQGGVGKTTLLDRYRSIAATTGFLVASVDEQQRTVADVLGRIAAQLESLGFSPKHFSERYKTYCQKMDEIESDPYAPQGLATVLGRTIVRATYIVGDTVPGLRKGLDYLPQASLESKATEWIDYLVKKLGNKNDIALIRDPIPILTTSFFEDLNELACHQRLLLCFDNFEATRQELQEWLLRLRDYRPSSNIRLVIAGRDQPGAKWDPLRRVTRIVQLDIFTEPEAEIFLDSYGITNRKRRKEILEWSRRLPVLMSWLAALGESELDTTVSTQDGVERFLRWVTDPALRFVALVGSIPQTFNLDLLALLLKDSEEEIDASTAFEWLQAMPFVQPHADGWTYHNVVKGMLRQYQRQKSPQTYRRMHMHLADYHDALRAALPLPEEEQWTHEHWRKNTLAYYHYLLIADPHAYWGKFLSTLIIAISKRWSFTIEMIDILQEKDVFEELGGEQKKLVHLLQKHRQTIVHGDLKECFELFEHLCNIPDLSPQAREYVYTYRGAAHSLWGRYHEALVDFNRAFSLNQNNALTITSRAVILYVMGRYPEALDDFNCAFSLNHNDISVITSRAVVYYMMGKYPEALADFDHALAINNNDFSTIVSRAVIYRLMGRYPEALAAFDKALAVSKSHSFDRRTGSILSAREETRFMGHHLEALVNIEQSNPSTDSPAIPILQNQGVERRINSLAEWEQLPASDEQFAWAITGRGRTYLLMGNYQKALADFDQAVALDNQDDWYRYCRAQARELLGNDEMSKDDLQAAITLAEIVLQRLPDNYRIGFNVALYALAKGQLAEARAQYIDLLTTCPFLIRLQAALDDVLDFSRNHPSHEAATQIQLLFHSRIAEIKREWS